MNHIKLQRAYIVQRDMYVFDDCDCWVYDEHPGDDIPYIRVKGSYKKYRADTLMFEKFRGMIQAGCAVKKTCKTTYCVNPYHQEIYRKEDIAVTARQRAAMLVKAKKLNMGLLEIGPSKICILKPRGYDRNVHSGDDYCRMLTEQLKNNIGDDWYTGENSAPRLSLEWFR